MADQDKSLEALAKPMQITVCSSSQFNYARAKKLGRKYSLFGHNPGLHMQKLKLVAGARLATPKLVAGARLAKLKLVVGARLAKLKLVAGARLAKLKLAVFHRSKIF